MEEFLDCAISSADSQQPNYIWTAARVSQASIAIVSQDLDPKVDPYLCGSVLHTYNMVTGKHRPVLSMPSDKVVQYCAFMDDIDVVVLLFVNRQVGLASLRHPQQPIQILPPHQLLIPGNLLFASFIATWRGWVFVVDERHRVRRVSVRVEGRVECRVCGELGTAVLELRVRDDRLYLLSQTRLEVLDLRRGLRPVQPAARPLQAIRELFYKVEVSAHFVYILTRLHLYALDRGSCGLACGGVEVYNRSEYPPSNLAVARSRRAELVIVATRSREVAGYCVRPTASGRVLAEVFRSDDAKTNARPYTVFHLLAFDARSSRLYAVGHNGFFKSAVLRI